MILKYLEIKKINYNSTNKILFYGANQGLKKEKLNFIISQNPDYKTINYNETDIINDSNILFEKILNKSFFDEKKIIIINNTTDKLIKILLEISNYSLENTILILMSDILDKKSKLRDFFEKEKNLICIAFYPDNNLSLVQFAQSFLKEKKISLSQYDLNLIVNRCKNDRINLANELEKISLLNLNKKITTEDILKLTNLAENYDYFELIEACVNSNAKKIVTIINENNFSADDVLPIVRIFLNKMKRLLKLRQNFEKIKDIDLTVNQSHPPIFWKDKDVVKKQIIKWDIKKIMETIFDISNLEIQIKNNVNNSIIIILNFILNKCLIKTNNKV